MKMHLDIPGSRDEIAKIQSEYKKRAVARARTAPFHEARLAHVDPDRVDDPEEWAKIPILDKEELRAIPPGEFNTVFNTARRTEVAEFWRSGGSTGVPLFYPRTFEDMEYCYESFRRVYWAVGAEPGGRAHVSFPLGIHPVGHMYARTAQQMGLGVNWAGAGSSTPSAMQIDLINRLQPTHWLGMSSYAIHLANLAEVENIDLAGSAVEMLVCSAEPLSDAKRGKMERAWGAHVRDTFGMTEAGLMGCESLARDGFHIWTDLFHIEVLDEKTGEPVPEGTPGLLVVTPLRTNHATPFLRWNAGDVVTYREHGDADGPISVFPVIKHAHRTVGFFKIRGINIGHQDFEDFMFRRPEIVDFKAELVTENALERLRVSVEVTRGGEPERAADDLARAIRETFQVTADVRVLERGTLAREFEGSVKAPRFQDHRA